MTPPAPHARLSAFELLFTRPLPARRSTRARPVRAPLVALAAVALLGAAHSERAIAEWPALVTAVEARVAPEDLLLFDSAATESAYVAHALRADDRSVIADRGPAPDLARRRRVWWIRASGGVDGASGELQPWRELERVSRPGVEASLLVRPGDP